MNHLLSAPRRVLAPLFMGIGVLASSIPAWPQGASLQGNISGSVACGRPEIEERMIVEDRTGHYMALTKRHCAWPMTVQGVAIRDGILSLLTDTRADRITDSGYNTLMMDGGDRIFMRFSGLSQGVEGVTRGDGTLVLSGGTGKFAGVIGRGTFKAQSNSDRTLTIQVHGEYTLPAAQ
jgi:hypothetical protein